MKSTNDEVRILKCVSPSGVEDPSTPLKQKYRYFLIATSHIQSGIWSIT